MKLNKLDRYVKCGYCYERYTFETRMPTEQQLRAVFKLSSSPGYSIEYIALDEPSGMDASWQHFKGKLTEGFSEAEFVEQYKGSEFNKVSVVGYLNDDELNAYFFPQKKIVCVSSPESVPASRREEMRDLLASLID